jgi:hypothetical protein
MKKLILAALAAGSMIVLAAPAAEAAQGCGPGFHRGYYGHCRPNGPVGRPGVGIAVGPLVIGNFYAGRGYWDGHRYWRHRERWHGGWRYR